jgi:protease-4
LDFSFESNIHKFTVYKILTLKSFFKIFFAVLLAMFAFFFLIFLFISVIAGSFVNKKDETVPEKAVLYIDLSKSFAEKKSENPIIMFTGKKEDELPSLYELIQLIQKAKTDTAVKGLYIKANANANGFAASEEMRASLIDFKKSGKFIVSYSDILTQKAFQVASVANKVYCNPKGGVEWEGFGVGYPFFKNLIDRLEIDPQIFYAGKFKSATEPFRVEKMTDANKLQTSVWLNDVYSKFLEDIAQSRNLDTALLRQYANTYAVETPEDAVRFKLIDGVKYDDEVKAEIRQRLKIGTDEKINFVTIGTYLNAVSITEYGKTDKIAVLVAEGDITDGESSETGIASEEYVALIRKLRNNKSIKAIVLRVNSPGGSSYASEMIWRELSLAQKAGKPVVVSMGDVAASGGYYISCLADSIFVQPNTITGSIGVFSIVPNFEKFLKNKVGVTFDGVSTSPENSSLIGFKPLSPNERSMIQREIDRVYTTFKQRIADGRKMDTAYVDSIAQGRVWTGTRAVTIGLADKIGSLNDAIVSAARLAKIKAYNIRVYPEPVSPFEKLFKSETYINNSKIVEQEIGKENMELFNQVKALKNSSGIIQARLPFSVSASLQ